MGSVPEMGRDQFLKLGWDRFLKMGWDRLLKRRVVFCRRFHFIIFSKQFRASLRGGELAEGQKILAHLLSCAASLNGSVLTEPYSSVGECKAEENSRRRRKEQKIRVHLPYSFLRTFWREKKVFRCSCLVLVGLLCSTAVLSQMMRVFFEMGTW